MKTGARKKIRAHVIRRDGGFCFHCGKRPTIPTMDHVRPRKDGGTYAIHNLVLACYLCNHYRGSKNLGPGVAALIATRTSEYFANLRGTA